MHPLHSPRRDQYWGTAPRYTASGRRQHRHRRRSAPVVSWITTTQFRRAARHMYEIKGKKHKTKAPRSN
ncbi:hypothetical protein J6590_024148 [Homalodisca vitripennis]|nr:hypothetical protein J6590_024148 [Homalodisca vitripennis]